MAQSGKSGSSDHDRDNDTGSSTVPRSGDFDTLKRTHSQACSGPETLSQFESLYGSDGRAKFQEYFRDRGQNKSKYATNENHSILVKDYAHVDGLGISHSRPVLF